MFRNIALKSARQVQVGLCGLNSSTSHSQAIFVSLPEVDHISPSLLKMPTTLAMFEAMPGVFNLGGAFTFSTALAYFNTTFSYAEYVFGIQKELSNTTSSILLDVYLDFTKFFELFVIAAFDTGDATDGHLRFGKRDGI